METECEIANKKWRHINIMTGNVMAFRQMELQSVVELNHRAFGFLKLFTVVRITDYFLQTSCKITGFFQG